MKKSTLINIQVIGWRLVTGLCAFAGLLWAASAQGADSDSAASTQNLCINGSFELLLDAAASQLPQNWLPSGSGTSRQIEIVNDAVDGKRSLRLATTNSDSVGMNSTVMACGHGLVRFHYKVLRSAAEGKNLAVFAIGLNGPGGLEITRKGFSPPKEHVADGQWHEATFEFDFSAQQAGHCLIAPRINENTAATAAAEWLIDNIRLAPLRAKAQASLAYVWSDKPLARTGERIRLSAFVENPGAADAASITLKSSPSSDVIDIANPVRQLARLEAGSFERVDWVLTARKPGAVQIEVTSRLGESAPQPRTYRVLVLDAASRYSRQEVCTDEQGYWRVLEKPATLQEGNPARLTPIRHKTSAEIKHNTYGVCIHLPRAKDYEDPFNPGHLVDNDPETCWSSQQRPSPYPGNPPWVEIDLGRAVAITQVNLIPYWHNTDFPLGFAISTSKDGVAWTSALTVKHHRLNPAGPKRGDKLAQCFPLPEKQKARRVRIVFERLPISGGNYAEVSRGYKARLSGVEILDDHGENLALKAHRASVKASEFFTGWQDTAASINKAFPRVMDIGLKWVRVGQWGDQTEWGAVEREKGKFAFDPVTEKAIGTLLKNKVDILYGLDYGNALYERPDQPGGGDLGPIYQEGHPFCFNGGPRTEAGRQAFVRYVDYVVRKYQHRIQWWELWNEENGWYPGFEPELYGKLLYATAKHIKEIDPSLKVMFGGTAAPAPVTTEISLREGAAPYLDATAFHPYGIDKPEGGMGTMEMYQGKNLGQTREQTGWNRLEEIVAGVKKPFAQHGNTNISVWLNEWGLNLSGLDYSYNPNVGEYAYAKYISRFYIYSGWLGHPAALWALHTENLSQDWSMIDPKTFGLRPLSYAMQNACSVVSDVQPVPAPAHDFNGAAPDLKVIAYQRDKSDERLVLLWSAQANTEKVVSYPGRFSFAWPSRPRKVLLTDLYWGLAQPARWTYENGRLALDGIIVRDYPIVISLNGR